MKPLSWITIAVTVNVASVISPQPTQASQDCVPAQGRCTSDGVAITGNNNRLGTTVFSFERVGAVTFGQFVGVWDENSTLPMVIDPSTPDDAILATIAPAGFPLYGTNAPNILFQNLRFQDVPSIIAPNGALGTIPSADDVLATVRSSGVRKKDYTLGQWLDAEGTVSMRCKKDGTTVVRANFSGLVPNGGLYSIWAFWAPEIGTLNVIPFGGSGTNAFATDSRGNAKLRLALPYCALDSQDDHVLVALQLDFHSDDGITGAFPNLPLVEGRGPGIIGHSHLIVPIRGHFCEQTGDCVFRP